MTLDAAHKDAVRTPVTDQVGALFDALGPTLVAYMAGVRSRDLPARWRTGAVSPRAGAAARLLTAYVAWLAITAHEDSDTARNWFIGANPWLGSKAPSDAIRNDDKRVLGAVQNFIEDAGGA